MTSKRFVILSLALTTLTTLLVVGLSICMNDFGLYGEVKAGEKRIWTYNRASKYLFSLNYIPKNFDAILVGSSSSAALHETRQIKSANTYNLSMNGANICEVAPAAINALKKGKMHFLVVCLSPYLTKNSMMKTSELSPNLLQSTYGSLFMVKLYAYRFLYTLFPEMDSYRDSWWGYKFITKGSARITQESLDKSTAQIALDSTPFIIDPIAVNCLRNVLETARERGTTILAYYHPIPQKHYAAQKAKYLDYQKHIQELFTQDDTILDFNSPEYYYFTEDISFFQDTAHLSKKGGDTVLEILDKAMQEQQR